MAAILKIEFLNFFSEMPVISNWNFVKNIRSSVIIKWWRQDSQDNRHGGHLENWFLKCVSKPTCSIKLLLFCVEHQVILKAQINPIGDPTTSYIASMAALYLFLLRFLNSMPLRSESVLNAMSRFIFIPMLMSILQLRLPWCLTTSLIIIPTFCVCHLAIMTV